MLSAQLMNAQLTVNNLTPQQAVETMLGEGIVVSNITFSGDANQIGSFNSAGTNLGIATGFMMASGDITVGIGPNDEGASTIGGGNFGATDPDLDQLDGLTHNDAAILEFDFVATGDTVEFKYVWASEEYPEYSGAGNCGNVSDVFGFFLSGPGINGPFSNNAENIALIPGTTQFVSIFNLNAGCEGTAVEGDSDCNYCEYYVYNGDGITSPYNTDDTYVQYDGFTTLLTAVAVLQCGQTYHIKLALADVSDTAFDSAVFIESDSFSSSGAVASGVINPPSINWPANQVMEDCVNGQFIVFSGGFDDELDTLELSIGGTATNGVDYEFIDNTLVLTEGQNSDTLFVNPINDGPGEGTESIIISFPFINACGELDTASAEIFIIEQTPLSIAAIDDIVLCGLPQVNAIPIGGFAPFTYLWSNGLVASEIQVTELGDYDVTVTDFCGQTATEDFEVVPPTGVITEMIDDVFVCLNGSVDVMVNVLSGAPSYEYDWTGSNSSTATASFEADDAGFQYVTITDNCNQIAVDSVLISIPSQLVGANDLELCVNVGTGELAEGGNPPYSYVYDEEAFEANSVDVFVPQQAGDFTIEVTDACGQEVVIGVLVSVCDTQIPNIFTPNGDSNNDFFEIFGIEDFPKSILKVYGRWGNLLYESASYSNKWSGDEHPDGVYYFILNRSDGKNFEGYVHILRD